MQFPREMQKATRHDRAKKIYRARRYRATARRPVRAWGGGSVSRPSPAPQKQKKEERAPRICHLPCVPCLYTTFCVRAIVANGRAAVPEPGLMDPDPKSALLL